MRFIEVIVLMGAHCVSPVQHTPTMTEAGKVQCAVVVEKDTETGEVKVTPEAASMDPQVAAVVQKLANEAAGSAMRPEPTIVPVGAPPASPQSKPSPPAALEVDAPQPEPQEADQAPEAPAAAEEQTAKAPTPPKEKPNRLQCKGGAVPKWYTTAEGRRKYRCVKA